jgi:hypothetical protein
MERECWRATVVVEEDLSVNWLADLVEAIKADTCLSCTYSASRRELVVLLDKAHSLKDAPSGTHEFARGWLAYRSAALLTRRIGKPVEWHPVKVYDSGRVAPHSSSSIHKSFTL